MKILLNQCKKQSREVVESDYPRIEDIVAEMIDLCREPLGNYRAALALAHCQIEHDDPLRFFVTHDGRVIINPKITWRGAKKITEVEGCYSWPYRDPVKTARHAKLRVIYSTMDIKGKVKEIKKPVLFEGQTARVFQHELQHFSGGAIY